MTLRDTDISTDDARMLLSQLKKWEPDRDAPQVGEPIRATFMVDLLQALRSPETANVENMAAEFENMALFHDFLVQDQMS
jgi:hypothetical protein